MNSTFFGSLPDGTPVEQFHLRNGSLSCDILTWAGTLRTLQVPDRMGGRRDVLLGFDSLEPYLLRSKYNGALVGRYSNRIDRGLTRLDGIPLALPVNDRGNHLHGGFRNFSHRLWTAEEAGDTFLTLSLHSPDGEEGYPGALDARVTYRLEDSALILDYEAHCDKTTFCSLTNHSYFNLAGHASGPVLDQEIQIFADRYTPADERSIPTGEIVPVDGTPLDFRESRTIGERIEEPFPQLVWARGYDQNFVIRGPIGTLRPAARAYSPVSGIVLDCLTTQPGMQFYTANWLLDCPIGKTGAPYGRRWGFCLETESFPDSPNHPQFPSCVLRPGETYRHTTVWRFSVR